MMLELAPSEETPGIDWSVLVQVLLLSLVLLGATASIIAFDPGGADGVPSYYASPRDFGYVLFKEYALAVEVISFQLLFAAVGAYYVGRAGKRSWRRTWKR